MVAAPTRVLRAWHFLRSMVFLYGINRTWLGFINTCSDCTKPNTRRGITHGTMAPVDVPEKPSHQDLCELMAPTSTDKAIGGLKIFESVGWDSQILHGSTVFGRSQTTRWSQKAYDRGRYAFASLSRLSPLAPLTSSLSPP